MGEFSPNFVKKMLMDKVSKDVQLITISKPSAYGEYEPYHFVDNEKEFEDCVIYL